MKGGVRERKNGKEGKGVRAREGESGGNGKIWREMGRDGERWRERGRVLERDSG